MLEGGHEYDGRPIVPFDDAGDARRPRGRSATAGSRRSAIAAMFSPLDRGTRRRGAAILREECPDVAVTLSHRLGRIGLLERENAALLNAALIELARTTIAGFRAGHRGERDRAPLYLTQNDGTVMQAEIGDGAAGL